MTAAINLFHILVVVPALFLVYAKRKSLPNWACRALLITGIVGLMYHAYKLITLKPDERWKDWIFIMHIALIFPLFIYIGARCTKTPRKYFEMSLVLAFAALGYHSYNLVKYNVLKK